MSPRKRLAIVAGELAQPRFSGFFETLKAQFEVTLYILGDEGFASLFESGMKCRIFPPIHDMPGYMRDLEAELATMDGILGLETTKLSTFQAVRAARKSHIPAGVIVTESQPLFYEKYPNIRAIQFDICHAASFFWATSQAAKDTLVLEGVSPEKIAFVHPTINQRKFRVNANLRHKFRTYVGIRQEDLIILCHGDLENAHNLFQLLEALRHLKQQATPAALRTKLMFVGDGPLARELKLKAVDQGLASQVMFLHQDPEPFLQDLFNACDYYLVPNGTNPHKPEPYPMSLIEAIGCGILPIVPAGSVAAEICSGVGVTYNPTQASSLVSALFRALQETVQLAESKIKTSDFITKIWNSSASQDAFLKSVATLMDDGVRDHSSLSPAEILRTISQDIAAKRELDALIKIEEAELRGFDVPSCQAELASLKGEALYNLGRMNEAMEAYSKCLQLDAESPACLRGLGFIAWHGHSNEEALTFFKKALAIREDDLMSAYGIGLVYRRLGLLDEALYWLERCVLKSREPSSAVIALAQTCAQLSPRSRGIASLERAIEAVGEEQALLATLGQLYLAEGLIEEGKELLQKALHNRQGQVA